MKVWPKNIFLKVLSVCFCSLALFSCSSFDLFSKKTVVPEEQDTSYSVTQEQAGTQEQESTQDIQEDQDTFKKELEKKNQHISILEDEVLLLEEKVSGLENQLNNQKPVVYTQEYADPSQLYQKARNLLLEGDSTNAAPLFETFIQKYPKHSLADNAMYWLGECYYSSGKYIKAAQVFKDLVKAYPKAEKVPDALLKTGYSYLSLDDINRANYFLKLLLKKYPFSPAASKAQEKLKEFE
jgi:tol-pal system protein YbgF